LRIPLHDPDSPRKAREVFASRPLRFPLPEEASRSTPRLLSRLTRIVPKQ
jgi:hypothetical protein